MGFHDARLRRGPSRIRESRKDKKEESLARWKGAGRAGLPSLQDRLEKGGARLSRAKGSQSRSPISGPQSRPLCQDFLFPVTLAVDGAERGGGLSDPGCCGAARTCASPWRAEKLSLSPVSGCRETRSEASWRPARSWRAP